jgi:hypothetical protein
MQNVPLVHESLLKKSLVPPAVGEIAPAILAWAGAAAMALASAPVSAVAIPAKSSAPALEDLGDRITGGSPGCDGPPRSARKYGIKIHANTPDLGGTGEFAFVHS